VPGKTRLGGFCVVAAVGLTACGGGKPWRAGPRQQFPPDLSGVCGSAISSQGTDERIVCRDSDGVYHCWVANKIDDTTSYEEVTPLDGSCKAALSAVKKARVFS
jgi:hypothetical protein